MREVERVQASLWISFTTTNLSTMTMSHSQASQAYRSTSRQIKLSLLVMLSIIVFAGIGVTTWFLQEDRVPAILQQIHRLVSDPPLWLAVPIMIMDYLRQPLVIMLVMLLAIMKLSPQPRRWSRLVVGIILLGLTARYVLWRVLGTLNLSDRLNAIFSLGLLSLELLAITTQVIQLLLVSRSTNRSNEADMRAIAV